MQRLYPRESRCRRGKFKTKVLGLFLQALDSRLVGGDSVISQAWTCVFVGTAMSTGFFAHVCFSVLLQPVFCSLDLTHTAICLMCEPSVFCSAGPGIGLFRRVCCLPAWFIPRVPACSCISHHVRPRNQSSSFGPFPLTLWDRRRSPSHLGELAFGTHNKLQLAR